LANKCAVQVGDGDWIEGLRRSVLGNYVVIVDQQKKNEVELFNLKAIVAITALEAWDNSSFDWWQVSLKSNQPLILMPARLHNAFMTPLHENTGRRGLSLPLAATYIEAYRNEGGSVSAEELVQIEDMVIRSSGGNDTLTALQIVTKVLKGDGNSQQDAAGGAGTADDDDDLS
jgi:hypothetical protein